MSFFIDNFLKKNKEYLEATIDGQDQNQQDDENVAATTNYAEDNDTQQQQDQTPATDNTTDQPDTANAAEDNTDDTNTDQNADTGGAVDDNPDADPNDIETPNPNAPDIATPDLQNPEDLEPQNTDDTGAPDTTPTDYSVDDTAPTNPTPAVDNAPAADAANTPDDAPDTTPTNYGADDADTGTADTPAADDTPTDPTGDTAATDNADPNAPADAPDTTPTDYGADDTGDAATGNNATSGDAGEGGDPNAPADAPDTTPTDYGTDDTGEGEEGADDTATDTDTNVVDPNSITAQLQDAEAKLFSDLTPQQITIRNSELKNQYVELYRTIDKSLARLSNITKLDQNIPILDFTSKKLTELKVLVNDYIINTFNTNGYLENQVNLKHFLLVLTAIDDILKHVKSPEEDVIDEE